jgi:hypothetical protein
MEKQNICVMIVNIPGRNKLMITDRQKLKALLEIMNGKDNVYSKGKSLIVCDKEKWMFNNEEELTSIVKFKE